MNIVTFDDLKKIVSSLVKRGDSDIYANIAQAAFDAAHPVGETYPQYPQQEDPHTLYNKNGIKSTWTVVNYSGAFFRAQGGNAAAFIDKNSVLSKQGGQNASHSHSANAGGMSANASGKFGGYPQNQARMFDFASGFCTLEDSSASYNRSVSWQDTSSNVGNRWHSAIGMNIDHTHTVTVGAQGGNENRPENYTIRVWKRTA